MPKGMNAARTIRRDLLGLHAQFAKTSGVPARTAYIPSAPVLDTLVTLLIIASKVRMEETWNWTGRQ